MVPLQLCRLHHAVAQRRQVLAHPANGALQPTVVRAVWLAEGQHLARRRAINFQHGSQLRFPVAHHLLPDLAFITDLARLVKHLSLEMRGQILLRHPVVPIGVRIEIARAMAKALSIAAGVFEMIGHVALALVFHRAQGIEKGKDRVRFRSGSQIERGLGERKAPFRQTHAVKRCRTRHGHRHGLRVSQADIFAGKNNHAAKQKPGILSGIDHFGQPIHGCIRIRAAQRFDKRGDRIVVVIAFLIIENGALLNALLRHFHVHQDDAICVRRCRFNRQLQRIEHTARIAISHVHQVQQSGLLHLHPVLPIAALRVTQGLLGNAVQIGFVKRFELENEAAAGQCPVDRKIGIFRGRPNQNDGAVFHVRQQGILLGFVKAMHLVDKQNGTPLLRLPKRLGFFDRPPDIRHPGQHRVDGQELALGGIGNHHGQGGFARARRPVENQRRELIRLNGAAQQPPRPQNMVLPDILFEPPGTHAGGQGLRRCDALHVVLLNT